MKIYQRLIYERKELNAEVLWLTLNNETKRNALDELMQQELQSVLNEVAIDNSIRCLVLSGVGEKAFCSGADINVFTALDNVSGYDYLYERGNTIQRLITYMEKPVIAAVKGVCCAGGMELALACDFIYATENAKFGLPEINLGLLAGWGGTVRLPRAISPRRAKEMIFRGEFIDAQQAFDLGLINRVFASSELMVAELQTIIDEMMAKPPLALRAAKNVINNSLTCDSIEAALSVERGSIMWLMASEDHKEGLAAFLEKKKPSFKGK